MQMNYAKGGNLMNITELTVHELIEKLEKKELTSTQITQAYVDRIETKINILAKNSSPEQVKKINKQFEQVKKQLIDDKLINNI